jgi:hypothetical protein
MPVSQIDQAKETFDDMKSKNGSKGLEVIVYPRVRRPFFVPFSLPSFLSTFSRWLGRIGQRSCAG